MDSITLEEVQWLTTDAVVEALRESLRELDQRTSPLKMVQRLRGEFSVRQSALLLEQAELRVRARRKFRLADQMLLTRRGLEQSSGELLADYKARRWYDCQRVMDVCCGIGGDLMSLVHRSPSAQRLVTGGLDADPVMACLARHNVAVGRQAFGAPSGEVRIDAQPVEAIDLRGYDAVHVDPDRRGSGRTIRSDQFSPPLSTLAQRLSARQSITIKVAPATPEPDSALVAGWGTMSRMWIGDRRECKQQLWMTGPTAPATASVGAAMIDGDGNASEIVVPASEVNVEPAIAPDLKTYLYEPHATMLAAGLVDWWSVNHDMPRVANAIGYLTTDHRIEHGLMAGFEILEVVALDRKALTAAIRQHQLGSIEWKHRGIRLETAQKLRSLKTGGNRSGVVVLTRVGLSQDRRALICRRLMPRQPGDQTTGVHTDDESNSH